MRIRFAQANRYAQFISNNKQTWKRRSKISAQKNIAQQTRATGYDYFSV